MTQLDKARMEIARNKEILKQQRFDEAMIYTLSEVIIELSKIDKID